MGSGKSPGKPRRPPRNLIAGLGRPRGLYQFDTSGTGETLGRWDTPLSCAEAQWHEDEEISAVDATFVDVEAVLITASSPDEKDLLFTPADDKVYRHPTFYDIPDEVGHM